MASYRAISRIASAGALLLMLSCGGGGGSSTPSAPPSPPPAAQGAPHALIAAPSATLSYLTVALDGSASSDSASTLSSYQWAQTAGPTVTIQSATSQQASFVAPSVTAASTIGIKLTVTDQLGTSASQSVNVTVNPPTASQITPAFIAFRQLLPVNGNPHLNAVPVLQTLVTGQTITVQITLSGALQSPTFTLEDASGNSLGTLDLAAMGDFSQEPLNFIGTMTVPSVPFQIVASGTSADGQTYSLPNPTPAGSGNNLISPLPFGVSFNVQSVRLSAAAPTSTVQATITNGGASALAFLPILVDPAGVDPSQDAPLSIPAVTVAAGGTQTLTFTLTYPPNPTVAVSTLTLALANNATPSQAAAAAALTLLLGN